MTIHRAGQVGAEQEYPPAVRTIPPVLTAAFILGVTTVKKFDVSKVRMCVDRWPQEPAHILLAAEVARRENPVNAPEVEPGFYPIPLELAVLTSSKWSPGRVIKIAFMDGSATQIQEVRRQAELWLPLISLSFDWSAPLRSADVRISFSQNGAWSYIGTDCLTIPPGQPTMNYGFLQEGTAVHEFGHMLGCIHEHQSPAAGKIPWIASRVYAYYGGPPNRWSKQTVDQNIFQHYAEERTQHSAWDKGSIMEYPIDAQLVSDPAYAVGWNTVLSPTDQAYIASVYPRKVTPPPPPPPSSAREVVIRFDRAAGSVEVDGMKV